MLPFVPESDEALKARFKAALEPRFTPEGILKAPETRPGAHRRYVFDFDNGIRTIISKEGPARSPHATQGKLSPEPETFLHASFSLDLEHTREQDGLNSLSAFYRAAFKKLSMLLGFDYCPTQVHQTMFVMHVLIPWEHLPSSMK